MSAPKFSTASYTMHFEDGEQVYPCRCGETHRGDYGLHDFMRHNCFHDAELLRIGEDFGEPDHLMCPDCGKSFEGQQ